MIIRPSDLAGAPGTWTRAVDAPSTPAAAAATSLFDDAAGGDGLRITADAGSGQRGLTVGEHAERILSLLRGDGGQR